MTISIEAVLSGSPTPASDLLAMVARKEISYKEADRALHVGCALKWQNISIEQMAQFETDFDQNYC